MFPRFSTEFPSHSRSFLWVPIQPRPSPGHTPLLTLENVCPVFWEPLLPYSPLTWQVPAWINLLSCPTCSFSSIPSFRNDAILHTVTKARTWESFWAPPQHSFLHPSITTTRLFGPWNVFRTPCSLLPNNSLLSSLLTLFLSYWVTKTTSSYLVFHPPICFQIDFSLATIVVFLKSSSGHISLLSETLHEMLMAYRAKFKFPSWTHE